MVQDRQEPVPLPENTNHGAAEESENLVQEGPNINTEGNNDIRETRDVREARSLKEPRDSKEANLPIEESAPNIVADENGPKETSTRRAQSMWTPDEREAFLACFKVRLISLPRKSERKSVLPYQDVK